MVFLAPPMLRARPRGGFFAIAWDVPAGTRRVVAMTLPLTSGCSGTYATWFIRQAITKAAESSGNTDEKGGAKRV